MLHDRMRITADINTSHLTAAILNVALGARLYVHDIYPVIISNCKQYFLRKISLVFRDVVVLEGPVSR